MSQASTNQPSPLSASSSDTPSSTDAVAMLSTSAARVARHNRPTFIIVLAALFLLAGIGYAVLGWMAHRDATEKANRAKDVATRILTATATIKAMQASDDGAGVRGPETSANVLSRIEGAGPRAGLSKPTGVGSTNRQRNREAGWDQVTHAYNIKDASLDAILRWIQLSLDENPGVEVSQVALRPEQAEWSMTVVFSRWEKPEGSP